MRGSLLLTLILFVHYPLAAQDGSNIRYVKSGEITEAVVGETVQVDFLRWSFPGKLSKVIDTVFLEVAGVTRRFIERRNDNGYNNWFEEQFLEARTADGDAVRIEWFVVREISPDTIQAEGLLRRYDAAMRIRDESWHRFNFSRDVIAGLLIKDQSRE